MLRMLSFILEPARNMLGKAQFRQRLLQQSFKFCIQRKTIDLAGRFRCLPNYRFALHETALHRIQRGQLGMPRLKLA